MKAVLFLNPVLDLFVCSTLPEPGHVHVFQRELHLDILTRYVSLGKLDNRLDMPWDNAIDVIGSTEIS